MDNWQIKYSKTGRPFFFNKSNGETRWKLPDKTQLKPKLITIFEDQFLFEQRCFELFEQFCDQFHENDPIQKNESELRQSIFFKAFGNEAENFLQRNIQNWKEKKDRLDFSIFIDNLCYTFQNSLILEYELFRKLEIFKEIQISGSHLQILFQNYLLNIFGCFENHEMNIITDVILIRDITREDFFIKLHTHFVFIRNKSLYLINFNDVTEDVPLEREEIEKKEEMFQKHIELKNNNHHLKKYLEKKTGLVSFVKYALTYYSKFV